MAAFFACERTSSSAPDPDLEKKALGLLLGKGVGRDGIFHQVVWDPVRQQYEHTWVGETAPGEHTHTWAGGTSS